MGEKVSSKFDKLIGKDLEQVDLLIVMGSTLQISPVSGIKTQLPPHVPTLLFNNERLARHDFVVEVIGDCDATVREISRELGWGLLSSEN
ncbi:NAD-dependent protein deacetylase sirtuin-1 [Entophlyctis luteolus]|nr:NAD-dependent protein deacetylase sirtuin-1 [Entophlyctis luteolus]